MCLSSFSYMQDASSHLHILPSLLLALVAAIPNHTLRYTALGLLLVFAMLCTIHLRSPSMQFRRLAHAIDQTDDLIQRTMAQYPREHFSLTQEIGRLLDIYPGSCDRTNTSASLIKCRILSSEEGQFNWRKFRMLSNDIAGCTKRVRSIRTAVLLIVEAEHQRKLAADIKETQFILSAIPLHP
ncbi:hypothetical protein B0H13DRAFT_2274544 [Mycena leptocephala]|nr:hypothetical protein B0H13DRAFT_2274544 [Mycena leptocephala]